MTHQDRPDDGGGGVPPFPKLIRALCALPAIVFVRELELDRDLENNPPANSTTRAVTWGDAPPIRTGAYHPRRDPSRSC